MIELLTILLTALILISMVPWIDYGVHISQVKKLTKEYGKGDYKTFIKEFEKVDWQLGECDKKSLLYFSNGSITSMICAGLIKFNEVGMIMKTPIDYWKMCSFLKKYFKNLDYGKEKHIEHKW